MTFPLVNMGNWRLAHRDTEAAALNADNYADFVRNPTNL